MTRVWGVLVGSGVALAGSCNDTSLSSAFDLVYHRSMSTNCVGPWQHPTRTIDVLTAWSRYVPLACAQTSCRKDFQDSASAIGAMQCDEAQVLGAAMANLVKVCNTLSLAISSLPVCSNNDVTNVGSVPATCSAVATTASSALDIVQPSDLKTLSAVCKVPSCVADLTNQITALPSCQTDWPYFKGAPLVPKDVYLGYLSSFCTNSTPPSVDASSCSAKVAELYARPFSTTCSASYYSNRPAYVIYEVTARRYTLSSRYFSTHDACMHTVQTVLSHLHDAGACAAPLLKAFRIFHEVTTKAYPSNISLPLCSNADSARVEALLATPASSACLRSPVVQTWSDVLTPPNLVNLASIASTPGCVASAVAFAKASMPPCEYAFPDKGDAAIGIDAATRFTSFLVTAELLSIREATPPLSQACLDRSNGLLGDTTKSVDLLTSTKSNVPLVCSIDTCRQDLVASSTSLWSSNLTAAQTLAPSVSGIVNLCNSLSISTGRPRCTSSTPFDMGAVPSECSSVASNAASASAIVHPADLTSLSSVCQVPACVSALFARINALPDCEAEWAPAYGALVSPKDVYRSYLSSFCNTSAFVPTVDFSSCSTKLAATYFTTFSNACFESMFEYEPGFGATQVYAVVLRQTVMDQYIGFSSFLASSPSCTASVNATAIQVDSAGTCGATVSLALKTLLKVVSTPTASRSSLAQCSKDQTDALTNALNAPATVECTRTNPLIQKWTDVFYPRYLTDMVTAVATPGCAAAAIAYAKAAFPACNYVDDKYEMTGVGDPATYYTKFLVAAQSVLPPPPSPANTTTTAAPTPTPTRSAAPLRSCDVVGLVLATLALALGR